LGKLGDDRPEPPELLCLLQELPDVHLFVDVSSGRQQHQSLLPCGVRYAPCRPQENSLARARRPAAAPKGNVFVVSLGNSPRGDAVMGEASAFAKSVNYCMHHRGVMQVRREAMSYTQSQPALPMVSGNRWAMVLGE
jgi:hypothetical protein